MPNRTETRTAARKTRTSYPVGSHKQGEGRQVSKGTATKDPRIIANSIFALTLAPKPGIEVMTKIGGNKRRVYLNDDNEDYYQMYHDLLATFKNALKLVKNEVTKFDPLAEGLEIGFSISYVLSAFKNNILPADCDVNIEKDDEGYHFVIYTDCSFSDYWHAFEICGVVKFLARYNPQLHKLFLELMRALMMNCDIQAWWSGGLGYADYMLEERVENWEHEAWDDEVESYNELQLVKECIEEYKSGLVMKYEVSLKQSKHRKPQYFISKLDRIRSRSNRLNNIIGWMRQAAVFLNERGCMSDFVYPQMEEDLEGVKFDQQAAIVWDMDDHYCKEQMECLDSKAQTCGVLPPLLNLPISKYSKAIDLADFKTRMDWPKKLNDLHQAYDLMINYLRK